MTANTPESFLFYTRSHCPLCEEMLLEVSPIARARGFALDIVDIDGDPALVERYGHKVPVLVRPDDGEGYEVCHFYLDEEALLEALED